MSLLQKLADPNRPSSFSARARKARNQFFNRLLSRIPRPLTILDIGGTEAYWAAVGLQNPGDIDIVLLNVHQQEVKRSNCRAVTGDARDMAMFEDSQFDVVFSNSMIEHVGTFSEQKKIAAEIQRVGRRYFVQTPNRYFPIEPHFLFPFFQFLPRTLQLYIALRWRAGWTDFDGNVKLANETIRSIRLLSSADLRELFPGASVYRERWSGMTKSFIVYEGWGG